MEVKDIKINGIAYEEFKDNEYLEQYAEELRKNGVNIIVSSVDNIINWGRSNSLWPLTFATSCCGIEFMSVGAARYDFARFGFEVTRNSPRQADVIIVAGGTQVIPEEGVKTGIDAAFGRNSHGIDVATFLVEERIRRRKAKEEAEKADK